MMYTQGYNFYRGMLDAAPDHADQNYLDYEALDQGPEGTGLRHQAVDAILYDELLFANVVDYGCGTGLLIPFLASKKMHIRSYRAVDFIPDHQKIVEQRLSEAGFSGEFEIADLGQSQSWVPRQPDEVAILSGLFGPAPFNDLCSLTSVLKGLMLGSRRAGLVTVPIQHPGFLGCERQAHFSENDLLAYVITAIPGLRMKKISFKEVAIWFKNE